jgi:hypothetical protein
MQIKTVDDIFETKRKIRTRLLDLLSHVPEREAASAIDGERWSIAQIVEHVAAVDESSIRVCAKLLSKAQADNDVSDGSATISVSFNSKADEIGTMKVEAPEIVQPKIGSTLAASIAKLNQTARRFEELKLLFRTFDGTKRKFPHPFFAEISAHEWLLLSGLHEERHTRQIRRLLENKKSPVAEEGMQPGNESKQ